MSRADPPDAVDRIVEGWQSALPDCDAGPLQIFSRVSRLSHRLDTVRRGVFAELDLQIWEFDVLSALRRTPPDFSLTAGQLLGATLVTSGTMTNRIDRLHDRGLATRAKDAGDKRVVKVRLTDSGRILVEAAFRRLADRERQLAEALTPVQQQEAAQLLRVLLQPLEQHA